MSRRHLPIVLLAAVVLALALGGVRPSVAQANVCTSIPGIPLVPNPIKAGCEAAGKAAGAVGKTVGKIVTAPIRAAGDAVMKGVTDWVADGAGWLVDQAGKLIAATTTPRLESAWFTGQYQTMGALAAVFALPLLLLSVLQGVLRRDGGVIIRAAFVQLPAAFLLTAGAVTVVVLLLQLTDAMSSQVASSVGSNASSFFASVAKALAVLTAATGSTAVPLFAVFLGGLIAAVAAFFVWVELLIRSAAIYVAVLFLPFTFVAMIWPHTARWCRRLVELLWAIIFSKFVIVAIMALAAAGMAQGGSSEAFQGVLAGTALMLLAAFSPMALLRLIPLVESAAHTSFRSGAGSQTLGPIAGPSAVMRRVVDANWGAGGGSGGGGLRAAPAGASAGGTGGAGAAGAGAAAGATMAHAVRTRAQNIGHQGANGSTPTPAGPASPGGDGRYATSGGSGQAARPSGGQPSGASASAPASAPRPTDAAPPPSQAPGGAGATSKRSRLVQPAPRPPRPPAGGDSSRGGVSGG